MAHDTNQKSSNENKNVMEEKGADNFNAKGVPNTPQNLSRLQISTAAVFCPPCTQPIPPSLPACLPSLPPSLPPSNPPSLVWRLLSCLFRRA